MHTDLRLCVGFWQSKVSSPLVASKKGFQFDLMMPEQIQRVSDTEVGHKSQFHQVSDAALNNN